MLWTIDRNVEFHSVITIGWFILHSSTTLLTILSFPFRKFPSKLCNAGCFAFDSDDCYVYRILLLLKHLIPFQFNLFMFYHVFCSLCYTGSIAVTSMGFIYIFAFCSIFPKAFESHFNYSLEKLFCSILSIHPWSSCCAFLCGLMIRQIYSGDLCNLSFREKQIEIWKEHL